MRQEDKFWKNAFGKPVRAAEWNDPDASLWDAIESAVKPPERKRRGIGAFLAWAGIASALVASALYLARVNNNSEWNQTAGASEVQDQNKNITYLNTLKSNRNTELSVVEDKITPVNEENNSTFSDEIILTKADYKSTVDNYAGNSSGSTKQLPISDLTNSKQKIDKVDKDFTNNARISHAITKESLYVGALENKEDVNPVILNSKFHTVKKAINANSYPVQKINLSRVASIGPFYLNNSLRNYLNNPEINVLKPVQDQPQARWTVALITGTGLWLNRPNQAMQEALEPFAFFENDAWAFTQSLQIDYAVSRKWQIFSGIQHTRVSFKSGHNSGLTYTTEDEINNGHNAFKLPVATPYGTVQTEIDLRREASINGSVELDADITTEQTLDIVSFPLGIRYQFNLSNRFSISPSLALFMNYNNSIKSRIDKLDTHSTVIVFDHANTSSEPQQSSRWSQSIAPGLDFNYTINHKWGLRLNTSHLRGISSSYESGDFQTHQDQWQFNIGITRSF